MSPYTEWQATPGHEGDDAERVFIGFTGTPLLKKDKATSMEVFGGYIHTYKFSEAVADEVVLDRKSKWSIAKLSLTKRGDRQSSAAQKPAGFLELRRLRTDD